MIYEPYSGLMFNANRREFEYDSYRFGCMKGNASFVKAPLRKLVCRTLAINYIIISQ